jgi:hypothetical protein
MNELLPCAHCGGEGKIRQRKTVIIECATCGALFIKVSLTDAIAAWNHRSCHVKDEQATTDKRENIVVINNCMSCKYAMSRYRWREVECWFTGAWVTKRTLLSQPNRNIKKPAHIPIPDWCPMGARKIDPQELTEWAMFDGKLRKVEKIDNGVRFYP